MSEFKGTKYKWVKTKHLSSDNTHVVRKVDTENGISICVIRTNNDIQADANLALISKAPEMLDMLIKCREYFYNNPNSMQSENNADAIDQLIKEATELR